MYNLPTLLYSVQFLNFVTSYLNVIKIITVVIMLKKESKTVKLSKKQLKRYAKFVVFDKI